MKKKLITWIIIVVVVGGIITVGTLGRKNKNNLVSVKTSTASQGEIKAYLSTTATIKSKNSKDYFPIQGQVKKVNVKVGDSVTKGQVLAEFDVADPNAAVKQAQLAYDNAVLTKQNQINSNNDAKNSIADIDNQISNIDKQIETLKNNPSQAAQVTQLENQKATLMNKKDSLKVPFSNEQLKQSDNNIALQKISLDTANANLSKSKNTIVADFDGVVTAVNLTEGATSSMATQPAITIQDVNNLKAVMSVGKYDASKIKIGQDAVIKNGQSELKGKVSFIAPTAEKTASPTGSDTTLNVEIDITDKPDGLRIDFDTDVDVLLGKVNNVIKVPAESIVTDKTGKTFIYTVANNKVVEKDVTLGLQSDMEAQIVNGVQDGDKVILNPSGDIKTGELVKDSTGDGK
ncbi:efflux RND transporter periplasmic adaptor subunit [Clostridium sp. 'White wine YQ']|uniref:efflux RND transporter periplasmic adaptor subunit n=1 Tax=Clostridium sp. 'White wine YQ' TaxID=3027474 RepID=UPI00236651F7|nr:efflux RND transporter periplasmic adaptor subunit [Clostridium sp. 'White wine YQ']MDD7795314.1 efflux RND transporter periplasmic adaptor subunit [Clostridium sp. 'White wine YQ']